MLRFLAFLVARFLTVAMCGFCHAPEHAYDELNDHPDIDRHGLCPDAHERLLIARTPRPIESNTLHAWDETTHTWTAYRVKGPCQACQAPTWRHAHETNALMLCRQCAAKHVTLSTAPVYYHGTPPTPEQIAHAQSQLPRQGPTPRGWLTFNEHEIHNTRDYEALPGPRAYMPRPLAYPRSGIEIARAVKPIPAAAPWE
ncbi:MAG: hypothetical protein WDA16_07960 [Candidatus Thermoplasmatota archaeon]